jgi:hypothetical protein
MRGLKTYLFASLIAAATVAHSLGYIDNTLYQALLGLFGAGGLAALRAAVPTKP